MLKRTQLRRYMLALLWHDDVPQGANCETGFLWTNCDGNRADVYDHDTHQLFENGEASYNLGPESIAVLFGFERVTYTVEPTQVSDADMAVWIEIICHDASGVRRQDILDQVEERILYRLLSYQTFTDASTGEAMPSIMRWSTGNGFKIEARDESAFEGNYTIRRLTFTLNARECAAKQGCDDEPICFDFTILPDLGARC